MKLIKTYSNNEIEVEAEDVLESLYDEGDFIEFEGHDRLILEKKGKRYILR